MSGTLLRLYVHDSDSHDGRLVWDAILRHANEERIGGCSVFRAMAGFGVHHIVHKGTRPFSIHADATLRMDFLISNDEATQLIEWVRQQGFRLFYAAAPAETGTIGALNTQ